MLSSYHNLDESLEALMEESDTIFLGILDGQLAPMPGLIDLLAALERGGVPKAIATSSRRSFTQRILGKFQFEPRFEFLLTGDDVTDGKPHPEIYLKAAARFDLEPRALLVLEDSAAGLEAAKSAGAFAVGVPHAHSPADGLTHADRIVDRLDAPELFALIDPPDSEGVSTDGRFRDDLARQR